MCVVCCLLFVGFMFDFARLCSPPVRLPGPINLLVVTNFHGRCDRTRFGFDATGRALGPELHANRLSAGNVLPLKVRDILVWQRTGEYPLARPILRRPYGKPTHLSRKWPRVDVQSFCALRWVRRCPVAS